MTTITLSAEFRIVIPEAIRERLGLAPGQTSRAIPDGEGVELIVVRPFAATLGTQDAIFEGHQGGGFVRC